MQLPKLKVLAEVGALQRLSVTYDDDAKGWIMRITYNDKTETLMRQRGGPRVFATLEAALNVLVRLGVHEFHVSAERYPPER